MADSLLGSVLEMDTIAIQITVGRRPRVSPTPVRELIPVVGAADVTLGTVGPKDRSDTLLLALLIKALQQTNQFILERGKGNKQKKYKKIQSTWYLNLLAAKACSS